MTADAAERSTFTGKTSSPSTPVSGRARTRSSGMIPEPQLIRLRQGRSMRPSRWILILAIGGVLLLGGAVFLVSGGSATIKSVTIAQPDAATVQEAQLRPTTPAPQGRPAAPAPTGPAAQPGAPAAQQPTPPRHVETTQYDSWVVTCQDAADGGGKKTCFASLRVVNQNKRVLMNWQIGLNSEGRLVTAVHVPSAIAIRQDNKTVGGAIRVAEGVELKFGNGPVRRLSFATCGPQQCVAEGPIDDGFIKEAIANVNGKANIAVHTVGGVIPFDVPMKGIDKAISSVRK
jgi:invasion protein IalB